MKWKMPAAGLILAAMVLGIVVGYMIFMSASRTRRPRRRSPATSRSCRTCSCG